MNLFYSLLNKISPAIKILIVSFIILSFNSTAKSTTTTITVQSNFFSPSNVSVSVGDTVKWQWLNGSHTTTCDGVFSGTTLPPGAAPWNSPMNSGSTVFIYPVTVPGTYNYVCLPHSPGMAGTIVASSSGGGILFTENFDYPAGDSIGAHGWNWNTGTTNTIFVKSPGLTFPNYSLSGIGNACHLRNNGNDTYKQMASADSTGSLYLSFMVKVDSARLPGDYFIALLPATSTTLYTPRFYAKDSLGGLAFGVSKSTAGAGGITYTSGNYSLGTTYLIVIKYTFNPGTNDDAINVFVLSAAVPSVEPATPTIGPVTGTATDNAIGRVALRQGSAANAPTLDIDGIQVSKSWSSITTSIGNLTSVPERFTLSQNYPNPFNPNTTISFILKERGFADLTVYNSLGMKVENLISENMIQGIYNFNFNGSNLNSGVYFYKLTFTNSKGIEFIDTKKLILVK
ncbi:MAG: T9SS type A sorting domain-containing protein [Ignavibacteria bacterium]